MKILRDGKEVKDAQVIYDTTGRADHVRVDGISYDLRAFELIDGETKVKTKEDVNPVETETPVDGDISDEPVTEPVVEDKGEPKRKTLFGRKKK